MKTLLRAASASRLLTDFIASPVGMRPAEHLSLIGDLYAGRRAAPGVRAALTPGNQTFSEYWTDGMDGPWNQPIYAIDEGSGIALLEICGPIVKGYDDFTAWAYECASIERIDRALDDLSTLHAAGKIRAIVEVINSPGGVSTGMPELVAKQSDLASRCLLVTHTSDTAASNAMRLAVASSLFLPTASSIVGCIGTYIALYNYTKMLEEMGIKLELYRAGRYKAIGLMGKDTDKDEAALVQAEVVRSNDIFREFVRARCPEVPDEAMEGQWFDGARAVEYGLADRTVTGLSEVMSEVAAAVAG